jgi:hypothetical protein
VLDTRSHDFKIAHASLAEKNRESALWIRCNVLHYVLLAGDSDVFISHRLAITKKSAVNLAPPCDCRQQNGHQQCKQSHSHHIPHFMFQAQSARKDFAEMANTESDNLTTPSALRSSELLKWLQG